MSANVALRFLLVTRPPGGDERGRQRVPAVRDRCYLSSAAAANLEAGENSVAPGHRGYITAGPWSRNGWPARGRSAALSRCRCPPVVQLSCAPRASKGVTSPLRHWQLPSAYATRR